MMMKDAQGLPFVGHAASFLLTMAPKVSRTAEQAAFEKERQDYLDHFALWTARMREEEARRAASPDYAALLADVADAATRFLELAGPHLAKIEGEGNWQEVLDANMAVAFSLERAVVALVRSTQAQGNLASKPTAEWLPDRMSEEEAKEAMDLLTPEVLAGFHGEVPPGPCAEQPFNSVSLRGTALIHACWGVDHLWLGLCAGMSEATKKSFDSFYATCAEDGLDKCWGLTEEQRLYLHNWHSAYKCRDGLATCLEIPALSPLTWDDEDEALANIEDHDINADLLRETAGEESIGDYQLGPTNISETQNLDRSLWMNPGLEPEEK